MGQRSLPRAGGFTLVELLIAMGVFLLVLLGIYEMFDTNRMTYISGTRKVDVQQNARVALDSITREIRMAGYFPESYDTDGTTVPALANARAVLLATDNGLVVYGDLDGACDPGQNPCLPNASRVFVYCLSGNSILRKVASDLTQASSFACAGGDILAEDIDTLTFTYYGANNVLIPVPTAGPKGLDNQILGEIPIFNGTDVRPNVRTIVVTLTARERVPGPGQQPQSYTLTSSVRLRNLPLPTSP